MNATPLSSPAMDAVLTMWARVPCSRMMGRKLCKPWTTPHRLTSKTHRQSSSVWSRNKLNVDTPALLHSTSTRPNRSSVVAAKLVDRAGIGDVDTDGLCFGAVRADARRHSLGCLLVEVGDDDRGARSRERFGEPVSDAARRAGHHRDPSRPDHVMRFGHGASLVTGALSHRRAR